jgi:thiol-disulfide isomerase/thioredoxin
VSAAPDALLLLSSSCPHCPAVLQALADLVKAGRIGRLEVINVAVQPERAAALGVRAVPWLRIGPFELAGQRSRGELEDWVARAASGAGMADYFRALLGDGELAKVRSAIAAQPELLGELLPIVADPAATINVRIGAGALFEGLAGSAALRALVPRLAGLAAHEDARVRADACFYLGLSGSAAARPALVAAAADGDAEVREIAAEALAELDATAQ